MTHKSLIECQVGLRGRLVQLQEIEEGVVSWFGAVGSENDIPDLGEVSGFRQHFLCDVRPGNVRCDHHQQVFELLSFLCCCALEPVYFSFKAEILRLGVPRHIVFKEVFKVGFPGVEDLDGCLPVVDFLGGLLFTQKTRFVEGDITLVVSVSHFT